MNSQNGKFSYYKAPVKNTVPHKNIDLNDLYKLLTGHYLVKVTQEVKSAKDYKHAKATLLPYITPAGIFIKRSNRDVRSISGFISFDFDHINVTTAKDELIKFEGVQFVYVSPSGKGLKVLIKNPYECDTYTEEFERLKKLIRTRTGLVADSTPDLARACFVCHDPEAWITPELCPQEYDLSGGIIDQVKGYPISWDATKLTPIEMMASKYPMATELITKLDLVPI